MKTNGVSGTILKRVDAAQRLKVLQENLTNPEAFGRLFILLDNRHRALRIAENTADLPSARFWREKARVDAMQVCDLLDKLSEPQIRKTKKGKA